MISNIILNENAYFYKKTKRILKRDIQKIFQEISSNKAGGYKLNCVKEKTMINGDLITYSICVYKYNIKPSFLDQAIEEEVKYSYLLLVEYKGYVVINKKNVSGLDKFINSYITGLDYNLISRLYASDNAFFERFTLNNMDISDNIIRRKSLEALNLKNSLAPFGASKYILNSMKVSEGGEKISLSFNTSRVNKSGKKVYINDFLGWTQEVVEKIITFVQTDTYLDHFSTPLNFEDEIASLTPNGILFMLSDLTDELENGKIDKVYFQFKNNVGQMIRKEINPVEYLNDIAKVFEVSPLKQKYYGVKNSVDNSLGLKVNKQSISLHSSKLKNIILSYENSDEMNLLQYLNKHQSFIISFQEFEVVYWARKLFKDSSLLANVEHFLDVFKPYSEIASITSEKGTITKGKRNFDTDSLFYFTENTLAKNEDFVFCDDLGNEWADHISIKKNEHIIFYHAKYGVLGLSASNFQEVVAQAQKNLGNIFASENELLRKKEKWRKKYSTTNIKRFRCGTNLDDGIKMYRNTLLSPNTRKEVYLVVNFISKSALEQRLRELKAGNRVEHEIIQILWLISSLIMSCKEVNTDVYIICLP